MLQFNPNHCKAQKMYKTAADYFPYALEYLCLFKVTQEMWEMWEKAVETYPSRLITVSNCSKTLK